MCTLKEEEKKKHYKNSKTHLKIDVLAVTNGAQDSLRIERAVSKCKTRNNATSTERIFALVDMADCWINVIRSVQIKSAETL